MLDGSPLVSCAASDFFIGLRRVPLDDRGGTTHGNPPYDFRAIFQTA